jgi:hypothetical protein
VKNGESISIRSPGKASLLEALERDEVSQWPSGFYRRAFIRAYAQAIDLDPDTILREFLEVHPEPQIDLVAAMASALGVVHGPGPISRVRSVADLAMGSLARLRRGANNDHAADGDSSPPAPVPDSPPAADVPDPAASAEAEVTPLPAADELSDRRPVAPTPRAGGDLMVVADLCTAVAKAATAENVFAVMRDFCALVGATGLIVWLWDTAAEELKPVIVHGYSDQVIALLPPVRRDDDNATAMAFRTAQTCALAGNDQIKAALVVPLVTSAGCAGVLAIELRHRQAPADAVRAVATIFAALLVSRFLTTPHPAAQDYSASA